MDHDRIKAQSFNGIRSLKWNETYVKARKLMINTTKSQNSPCFCTSCEFNKLEVMKDRVICEILVPVINLMQSLYWLKSNQISKYYIIVVWKVFVFSKFINFWIFWKSLKFSKFSVHDTYTLWIISIIRINRTNNYCKKRNYIHIFFWF